jgi:hypothetical protein
VPPSAKLCLDFTVVDKFAFGVYSIHCCSPISNSGPRASLFHENIEKGELARVSKRR